MRTAFLASLTATLLAFSTSAWAQSGGANECDLTGDGTVDFADVTLAVNMTLGLAPCTANVQGTAICNAVTVQRVVNASLGGPCVTGPITISHAASLNWIGSTTPNLAGYNVYRGSAAEGPYVKLTGSPVSSTFFTDSTVKSGQTYYYVATAVDLLGAESVFSTPPVQAVIPDP